jgi:predicted dehydrogenase
MLKNQSRRSFLQQLGTAGVLAPAFVRHLISAPPSGRVRLASFGANGMAWSDLTSHLAHPKVDLVTVAEVDSRRLDKLASKDPEGKVRVYQDWRQLLEKEAKNLDAVTIATPDHMHAPIGVASMQLGLHAYIQKPLAHDLNEVRRLTEIARERKLQTQMGIQVHSSAQYRTAVNLIHSGVIGKIREVHTWSNKKWGDSEPEPAHSDPVPQELNWDLWLGVAPERPFVNGIYHPGNWRKRLAFGTGTFGDMGCHIYDPVFKALGVGSPISVRSEGPAPSNWSWAINAVVHYVFPGSKFTDGNTVKVVWYDGDEKPPADIQSLLEGQAIPAQGSIFIGTKGRMLLPHVDWPKLFPLAEFKDYQIEKAAAEDHRAQFIDAVLGGPSPSASFDYSGPLTEAILLGGVASFHPKTTLEWDSAAMRFPKHPEADKLVRRPYRKGWEVPALS